MDALTLVLPHFMNLKMFAEQQRVWAAYPADLRARLHVIVVDDGSPKGHRLSQKQVTVEGLASLRMFRLVYPGEKVRWNWLACRNLGAAKASTDWLFLTDMDHVIPAETLARVLEYPAQTKDVYRFSRVTAARTWPYRIDACEPYKPHNDTWLMAKSLFFDPRVGGYDERLSGCYGTSGEFTGRLRAAARAVVLLPDVIVRYPREVIADASTSPDLYTRKNDPVNEEELRKRKHARACIPNWTPVHGLVPSQLVYSAVGSAVAA